MLSKTMTKLTKVTFTKIVLILTKIMLTKFTTKLNKIMPTKISSHDIDNDSSYSVVRLPFAFTFTPFLNFLWFSI